MASNVHIGIAARKAALDNAINLSNSGSLVIYSGAQPVSCDAALSGNTALATFVLANPAFANASGVSGATAVKALNLPANVGASATGTATWFRIYQSDGITGVADGTVGTSGSDLNLNSVAIQIGATVSIVSGQYTLAA